MKIKKLLSIILSVSCMFSFIFPLQVFAEDYCAAKNSKGGYLHQRCADPELVTVRKNQADFASVENLGPLGDEERYCFNFRALDDVYEKKKLISVAELRKERNTLSKVYYHSFFNLYTTLAIGLTGFMGALGGYFFQKIPSSEAESQGNANFSPQNSGGNSNQHTPDSSPTRGRSPARNNLQPGRGVLPACIGALIAGLASFIGLYANYDTQKNNFETDKKSKLRELNNKIVEINRSNERKSDMLNLLLFFLDRPKDINFDMVCFFDNSERNFHWDPKHVGINYTKAELESFPKKFKEIAAKIRKNLEETGYLDSDNEISSKIANPEQRELGD